MAGINLVFAEDDIMFTREFYELRGDIQFHRDLKEISEFCRKEGILFRRADITRERGRLENIYYFSDNLGGYLIEAIRGSY